MAEMKTDEKSLVISVLQGEITQCRNDITAYNTQFLASSVLCAILAALAATISTMPADSVLLKLFYLLPTIYFLSLYNIIKYGTEQMKLGAYRRVLEHLLNQYLNESFMRWERSANQGFDYVLFGGVVQIFFDIPISLFMLLGFVQIPDRSWFWYIVCVCLVFQITAVIIMAISMCFTTKRSLKHFGYELKKDGSLVSIESN